jgi:hypothetical protein
MPSLVSSPATSVVSSAADMPAQSGGDPWEQIGWNLLVLLAVLIILVSCWIALEKTIHSIQKAIHFGREKQHGNLSGSYASITDE